MRKLEREQPQQMETNKKKKKRKKNERQVTAAKQWTNFLIANGEQIEVSWIGRTQQRQAQKQITWSAREAEEWLGKDEWKAWNQLEQIPLGLQRKIFKI